MTLLHEEIEKEVIKRIRPTEEEKELRDKVFSLVREKLEKFLSEKGLEADIELQGSARKGTWLRGNLELDVFILFEPRDKEWIKEVVFPVLLEAAKELGPYEVRFAEHPYVRVYVLGVPVELVPAFKVEDGSKAITAVDRTPFHTRYVLSKIKELGEQIVDEIRLMKAFLKGIGTYGAEIKVRGFSGYATELLVLHYGGFGEALRAISKWRPPVVVNANKDAIKRFPNAEVIMLDPVDPRRNVTAAVSAESLSLTILAANRYISKPKLEFFFPPQEGEVGANLPVYLIEFPIAKEPPETVWGELKRIGNSIVKNLKNMDFRVTRWHAWTDEKSFAAIVIELLEDTLPEYEVIKGPPVWLKNANDFLDAHIEGPVWVEGYRLYALRKRRFRKVDEAIVSIIKNLKAKSLKLENFNLSKVEKGKGWLGEFLKGRKAWM